MKNCLLIALFLAASGCRTKKVLIHTKHGKTNWEQSFKDYTLCKCLLAGYSDKNLTLKIKDTDKSFASPINQLLFDSIATVILDPILQEMKKDSVLWAERISERAAGKHVFENCIRFYRSKILQSVAKKESRKWRKIEVDSLLNNDATF